jgi:dihydropteroate synthase
MRDILKWKCRSKTLELGKETVVCGVLNLTPDSFSDGGLYADRQGAIEKACQMVDEGAGMIDVGGESTRPGALPVSVDEERRRVMPVLEELVHRLNVPVSVDTYKSQIAKEVLEMGVDFINDITSLRGDPDMASVVAGSGAGIILMHMQGTTPRTMQENPQYGDVVSDIAEFLSGAVDKAVSSGINREKIVVDPGIGFGKRTEHNLEIIKRLCEFESLGRPILIGVSRKSVIGNVLDLPVDERLEGTAALVACAIENGAHIVRVHDVKYMCRVARMVDAVKKGMSYRKEENAKARSQY